MGCFGVFALNVDHPDTFAAIVESPEGSSTEAAVLAKKPIWVFHAAQDLVVDVKFSRETVEALKAPAACRGTPSTEKRCTSLPTPIRPQYPHTRTEK